MQLTELKAIAPIDGRYWNKVSELSHYFSEFGLMQYRLKVEIEYFIALCETVEELKEFPKDAFPELRKLYQNFDEEAATEIKAIEKVTNHDVKAIEYYLKDQFIAKDWSEYKEFIHFGLTSQDINNTAIPMSLKEALENHYLPFLQNILIGKLKTLAKDWKEIPMLARTHGQAATPTRLGKEFQVYVERMEKQVSQLAQTTFECKFGGATGNFNAHYVAYPNIDWLAFADHFTKNHLGLDRQQFTTQIAHYDDLAGLFDNLKRINTILLDFSKDVWQYISLDYFGQKLQEKEVGSSAMPHKVNPIDFENAEGNSGMANALLGQLSEKLPVSRMQRDLSDSTVTRNIGMPLAYAMLAFKSLKKGLDKLEVKEEVISGDLENHWPVIAEAIQTVLRKEGYPKPYEALKDLTRTGEAITKESLHQFIDGLTITDPVKERLKSLTPGNYTGRNPQF